MATDTYNDITLQLVTLMDNKEDGTEVPPPKRFRSEEKGDTQQRKEEHKREEQRTEERQLTREEGGLLREFLSSTSNQLTQHGIEQLQRIMEEVREGEVGLTRTGRAGSSVSKQPFFYNMHAPRTSVQLGD